MKSLLLFVLTILSMVAFSQPTTNPYADLYGDVTGHWTEDLPWDKVYNINDYSGANWDEKVVNAQNDIVSKGGGVLYFPAGTYTFTNDLILRRKVILRGEASLVNDGTSADFAPLTRFEFPAFTPVFSGTGGDKSVAFKRIRSEFTDYGLKTTFPADTSRNMGLVNIDINRANIIIHPSYVNYIPSGAGVSNYRPCFMENIIVMGIRNNNVSLPLPAANPGFQEQWQVWPYRYLANLDALAQRNLLICNNRFNDRTDNNVYPIVDESFDQPGYKIYDVDNDDTLTIANGAQARFFNTNHYGIVVNRFYNFYVVENGLLNTSKLLIVGNRAEEPDETDFPSLFYKGVEIKNNYMYNTQQAAFFVAGQGMVIKDNVIRDNSTKQQWVSRSGYFKIKYDAFLENRGIDFSGFDVTIENNDVEVYPTRFETSSYYSNDGEGIMLQECCGGTRANGIVIRGNKLKGSNAYIGLYKTRDISNVLVENNLLDGQDIYLNANTNAEDFSCYNVSIKDNSGVNDIVLTGSTFGDECYVTDNSGNSTGDIVVSCYVQRSGNTGFNEPACTPLIDYASQSDTLCTEYMGTEFCFPNFKKEKWECLQAGYPIVEFDYPADTIFVSEQNTLTVKIKNSTATIDSIMLICNGVNYPTRLMSDPFDEVDISRDGTYYLTYKSWSCGYMNYAYSKGLFIIKDSDQLLSNENKKLSQNLIKLYPNPADDFINIESYADIKTIQLLSMTGVVIKSFEPNHSQLNVSKLTTGIYLVKIETTDEIYVQKITIK